MIRGNRASLSIHSDTRRVSEISAMLGLEPTDWGDEGDLTPAGQAGRDFAPEYLTYQRAFWSLTESVDESSVDDQTGFSALRVLVSRLMPSAHALRELRQGGETVLWWSGDSDSTQGGFVMPADLVGDLAALGCDVLGTAFLAEDADAASGERTTGGFTQQQKVAVRHAFSLAGYDGELRTLPDQTDGVIVFVVAHEDLVGDARSLEIVLSELLGSRIMVTGDIGAATEEFESRSSAQHDAGSSLHSEG